MRFTLLLMTFLAGCGSEKNAASTAAAATATSTATAAAVATTTAPPAAPSLIGVWSSGCINTGTPTAPAYLVATKTVTATEASVLQAFYSADALCLSAGGTRADVATYVIGAQVAGLDNAWKIDQTLEKSTVTIMNQTDIKAAISSNLYGYSDWTIGVAKDITGRAFGDGRPADDAMGTVFYGIFKVDANKYASGDTSSGDGSTDAKRPTSLRTTAILTKQ